MRYELTITKNSFESNDPGFELSYKNLNGHPDKSQRPNIIDYFFETSDGDITQMYSENHKKYSAINLYRLGLQVFYDRLKNLPDYSLHDIKTDGQLKDINVGLWRDDDQMRKERGHNTNAGIRASGEYIREDFIHRFPRNNSEEGLSFYNCGMYDSLIGCQELLKLFNDDGKFIVEYTRGREEHNGDNMSKSAEQTLSLQEFTNILKFFTETAQAKIYYKSSLNEKYHYPYASPDNNSLSLYTNYGKNWQENIDDYPNVNREWFSNGVRCMHFHNGRGPSSTTKKNANLHFENTEQKSPFVVEIGLTFSNNEQYDSGMYDNYETITGYRVELFGAGIHEHGTAKNQDHDKRIKHFSVNEIEDIYRYTQELLKYIKNEEKSMYNNQHQQKTTQNIIYYGVPGTGKSYTIEREWGDNPNKNSNAEDGMIVVERTVFHPEYDNTDFVGQLLPVTHKQNSQTANKQSCSEANNNNYADGLLGEIQKIYFDSTDSNLEKAKKIRVLLELNDEHGKVAHLLGSIFPNDDFSHMLSQDIEGFEALPDSVVNTEYRSKGRNLGKYVQLKRLGDDNALFPQITAPAVTYEFTPGPFARILARAIVGEVQKDKRQYNLIIEEINRGNAAAIFGEIFQLLDREDNYEINNKQIADYVLGEVQKVTNDENRESLTETIEKLQQGKVWLPSNLNIIASMNTSDQNVFTLDNAFQRRFEMRRLPNNFASDDISGIKDTEIANTGILWGDFRDIINNQIVQHDNSFSSEDKLLGPHFVTPNDLKNTDGFTGKVIKYLWQDVCRMQPELLFANDIKSLQGIYDKIDSGEFIEVFTDAVKDGLRLNNTNENLQKPDSDNESA